MCLKKTGLSELEMYLSDARTFYGKNCPNLSHYCYVNSELIRLIPIKDILSPKRTNGEIWFRNECAVKSLIKAIFEGIELPPIQVKSENICNVEEIFQVVCGFHRYYLSTAIGFTHIPVVVNNWDFEV